MKKWYLLVVLTVVSASCYLNGNKETKTLEHKKFSLTSTAFAHNGSIPAKYTCDGEDISPQLQWNNPSEQTKSFALIVDDPDAPTAKPWVHWILFNIDPTTTALAEAAQTPHFVQGITNFGHKKYGGPCPPSDTHRYFFKLYALDKKLDLTEGATKEQVLNAMHGHIIAQTELIGLYHRIK